MAGHIESNALHLQMEQLMVDCLLPAMCMVPAQAALANEVWGALNLLDCTDRWRIYTALKVSYLFLQAR